MGGGVEIFNSGPGSLATNSVFQQLLKSYQLFMVTGRTFIYQDT
jgi:hypothetical protein